MTGVGQETGAKEEINAHADLLPSSPQQRQLEYHTAGKSLEQHIQGIVGAYQKGLESILETGQLLIAAKKELQFGTWEKMATSMLPFDKRTAERLMALAHHPVISNPAHAPLLPPSWMTLYELTKLDDKLGDGTLVAKLGDGTITAATLRKDVAAMLRTTQPTAARATPRQNAQRTIEARQAHIEELEAAREIDDVGRTCKAEISRKLARLDELETEVVQLRHEKFLQASEIGELRVERDELKAELERVKLAIAKSEPPTADEPTHHGDGFDIPEFLLREPASRGPRPGGARGEEKPDRTGPVTVDDEP